MDPLRLAPRSLTLAQLRAIAGGGVRLALDPTSLPAVRRGAETVRALVSRDAPAYGVNTGFGRLAQTHIPQGRPGSAAGSRAPGARR